SPCRSRPRPATSPRRTSPAGTSRGSRCRDAKENPSALAARSGAGLFEPKLTRAAAQVRGAARVARDAVALRVRGGQEGAAFAGPAVARLLEELRGLFRIGLDSGARRVNGGGVEAAERIPVLAPELRELASGFEILLDPVAGEKERAEKRTGPRAILLGMNV